jgi:hypothetical protein
MRATRLGALLLGLGLLVGSVAGLGLLIGFEPSRLPSALLDLAAYKLTFLAAFGLLAAGAVVRRHAREAATRRAIPRAPHPPPLAAPHAVHDGLVDGARTGVPAPPAERRR